MPTPPPASPRRKAHGDSSPNWGYHHVLVEQERRDPGILSLWALRAVDQELSLSAVFEKEVAPHYPEYMQADARRAFKRLYSELLWIRLDNARLRLGQTKRGMERAHREMDRTAHVIALRSAAQHSSAACNQGRTRRRPTTTRRTASRGSSSRGSPGDPDPSDEPPSQRGDAKQPRHLSEVLADWLEDNGPEPLP